MSNKHIAISWAAKQVKAASGFVYSDKFFGPFNETMKAKIAAELLKFGVVAWSDTLQGAFLFKSSDKRLLRQSDGNYEAAIWCEGDKYLCLPIRKVGSV